MLSQLLQLGCLSLHWSTLYRQCFSFPLDSFISWEWIFWSKHRRLADVIKCGYHGNDTAANLNMAVFVQPPGNLPTQKNWRGLKIFHFQLCFTFPENCNKRTYMFYQMEGKLSALNFKARQKMSTLWKYWDFEHEKFAFLCPNGTPLEN